MKNKDLVDDIKELIKSLYNLANKSSTGLTIKSMHDCAQIVSKIYGFNSWNELKQNLDHLKKNYTSSLSQQATEPKYQDVKIKKNEYFLAGNTIKAIKEPVVLEEKNLLQEIIIGKSYNALLKTSTLQYLEPEDFMLISSLENTAIFKNIKKQISKFNNSSVHLTASSNIKLDPWKYIFEQNGIELLFKIKENKNEFMMSWISTFRFLNHELNFQPTIKEAIEYLSLEGAVNVYDWLKRNRPSASWYLQKYLEDIGVIENKNDYFISTKTQEKHWHNIQKEVYILQVLAQLYKDKSFQTQETDLLWNNITQRKNIKIGLCSENFDIYKELVSIELNRVTEQYDKLILNQYSEPYKFWLLCDNLEQWETSSLLGLNDKDCLIRGYITQGKTENLNSFLSKVDQVIIGKLINVDLPQKIIEKMLNKTKYWEENIWFNDKKALKVLKINEFFFWYAPKDLNFIKELRDFTCQKIVFDPEQE